MSIKYQNREKYAHTVSYILVLSVMGIRMAV